LSDPDDKSKPAVPPPPKTERTQRVPSFAELQNISSLGPEEKTAQISPEMLRQALAAAKPTAPNPPPVTKPAMPAPPLPPQAIPPGARQSSPPAPRPPPSPDAPTLLPGYRLASRPANAEPPPQPPVARPPPAAARAPLSHEPPTQPPGHRPPPAAPRAPPSAEPPTQPPGVRSVPAAPRAPTPQPLARPPAAVPPGPATSPALAIPPEPLSFDEKTAPGFFPQIKPQTVVKNAFIAGRGEEKLDLSLKPSTPPPGPAPRPPGASAEPDPSRATVADRAPGAVSKPMAAPPPAAPLPRAATPASRAAAPAAPAPAPAPRAAPPADVQPDTLDATPHEPRPAVGRGAPTPSHITERVAPITPDMLPPGPRVSPARPAAATLTSAPAAKAPSAPPAPRKADPSLFETQLTDHGASQHEPRETRESELPHGALPRATRLDPSTQPHATNPVLPRGAEPPSGDHAAVPQLPPEPPTRNERPLARPVATPEPFPAAPAYDINADILSEIRKLPGTDPTGKDVEQPTGRIHPLEVIAHPAPLWRRVLALLVDGLVLGGLIGLVAMAVLTLGKAPHLSAGLSPLDKLAMRVHDSAKLLAAIAVMAVGIAVAYSTLFAASLKGRTLGRLVAGIFLVDKRGGTPGPVRALIRSLFAVGSFAVAFSGFWWSLFDRRGQTLHDKLCSTFVVRFGARRT
jgi:uncharacterized RDD family membrane protein YckC